MVYFVYYFLWRNVGDVEHVIPYVGNFIFIVTFVDRLFLFGFFV